MTMDHAVHAPQQLPCLPVIPRLLQTASIRPACISERVCIVMSWGYRRALTHRKVRWTPCWGICLAHLPPAWVISELCWAVHPSWLKLLPLP